MKDILQQEKHGYPNVMAECPDCGGPHFNVINDGHIRCANWNGSKDSPIGCGWVKKFTITEIKGE